MGYFDEAIETKNNEEVLEHHGIRGQKWGVRRFQNKDGSLKPAGEKRYGGDSDVKSAKKSAKAEYKAAKKEYNKSFNKAYNTSANLLNHLTKKGNEKQDKTWGDTYDKLKVMDKAQKGYKKAKENYKKEYNKNLDEVRKNATFKENIVYNDATRRRAAKLMTDNKNITYEEASKKAKGEAVRNTAIILGVYGAVTIGAAALNSKKNSSIINPINEVNISKSGGSVSETFDKVFGMGNLKK